MTLFSSNARLQKSLDSATKTFQSIVHQSTAAFSRNANEAAKKATDSIETLSVRGDDSEAAFGLVSWFLSLAISRSAGDRNSRCAAAETENERLQLISAPYSGRHGESRTGNGKCLHQHREAPYLADWAADALLPRLSALLQRCCIDIPQLLPQEETVRPSLTTYLALTGGRQADGEAPALPGAAERVAG